MRFQANSSELTHVHIPSCFGHCFESHVIENRVSLEGRLFVFYATLQYLRTPAFVWL